MIKTETQRQRAEFAAGVRNRDKGHPVFLSDEAVDDLAAIVDEALHELRDY